MRRLILIALALTLVAPAMAQEPPRAPTPDEAKAAEPPARPDYDAKVVITLRQLDTIIASALAQAEAKREAAEAKPVVEGLLKQATP